MFLWVPVVVSHITFCGLLQWHTRIFLRLNVCFFSKGKMFHFCTWGFGIWDFKKPFSLPFSDEYFRLSLMKRILKFITSLSLLLFTYRYIMMCINYPEKYKGRIVYADYGIIIYVYYLLHSPTFLMRILSKFAFQTILHWNIVSCGTLNGCR